MHLDTFLRNDTEKWKRKAVKKRLERARQADTYLLFWNSRLRIENFRTVCAIQQDCFKTQKTKQTLTLPTHKNKQTNTITTTIKSQWFRIEGVSTDEKSICLQDNLPHSERLHGFLLSMNLQELYQYYPNNERLSGF